MLMYCVCCLQHQRFHVTDEKPKITPQTNRLFLEATTKTIRDVTETEPTTCIQCNIGSGMLFIEPCRHNKSGASFKTQSSAHDSTSSGFIHPSARVSADSDIVGTRVLQSGTTFTISQTVYFLLSPPKAELCTCTDKLAAHQKGLSPLQAVKCWEPRCTF